MNCFFYFASFLLKKHKWQSTNRNAVRMEVSLTAFDFNHFFVCGSQVMVDEAWEREVRRYFQWWNQGSKFHRNVSGFSLHEILVALPFAGLQIIDKPSFAMDYILKDTEDLPALGCVEDWARRLRGWEVVVIVVDGWVLSTGNTSFLRKED